MWQVPPQETAMAGQGGTGFSKIHLRCQNSRLVTPRVGVVTTSCTRENLGGEWARNILILGPRAGYVGFFGFQKSCSWVKRPSIFLRVHSTSQKPYFHTGFRPSPPLPHPMFTAVSAPILRPFHDLILKTNCFSVHFVRLCLLTFFFKY